MAQSVLISLRSSALYPLQPLKIPETRLLFIYFVYTRRGVAGRPDCCLRMAGLSGFSPLRETERCNRQPDGVLADAPIF